MVFVRRHSSPSFLKLRSDGLQLKCPCTCALTFLCSRLCIDRQVNEVATEQFGTVMVVAVGATVVGSIIHTVAVGDTVDKGQELGYFAFGGSTVLTLFQAGTVQFDEDLLRTSSLPLETLVKVRLLPPRLVST